MTITVYTKPMCVQCTATYRALDKQGLPYTSVDVSEDVAALEFIKGLGYQQAPVVIAGDDHWSGYRPDRIKAAAAAFEASSALRVAQA
ncbi:glutaredoxin-like protein NrdH [Schaalia sp. Marseille-Q2122]|uniref:glutaredoxin-like protein NrdH n=1 Tax=Schaalia sp. Marseille-Q2122 TaxID=2736604 RepID=UPI00158AD02D|nr:glutaredoxin-like protein NrdH [Schaalia sp. Marseille-Q2122]